MDKRRPETLPDSGSEIYDPEGAARLMEKELAKRWNLGIRKTPITSGSATTDLGGKLPPRPWLTNSPAARTFAPVDWSVFGELPPFVSPGKWSVDEIHAFISDGAAGPDGLDSDTLHALSDESLEALAELLDHADQGHWPTSWSEARTVLTPKSPESPPGRPQTLDCHERLLPNLGQKTRCRAS